VSGYDYSGTTTAATGRKRHGWRNVFVVVLALLIILVVVDRLAVYFVQGKIASEIQDQGFSTKPDVSVKGFPFLTQVAARDLKDIEISSNRVKAGPVVIKRLDADMKNTKVDSSFSGGTVGHLDGSGLISFGGLSNTIGNLAGGGPLSDLVGSGLTLSSAGNDEIKAKVDLAVISGSAVLKVVRVSGTKIKVQLISSNGLPSELTDQLKNLTVPIPSLPLGLKIQSVSVTSAGISIHVIGNNVKFGS
jgi:LmeA-like phospholipid-binding